jgi:hypothetical protein
MDGRPYTKRCTEACCRQNLPTNPSVSRVSDEEPASPEYQGILLRKRDLALHNGAKASIFSLTFAEVAELVDAHDSGSCGGHLVEVRVLSSALGNFNGL